MQQIKQSKTKYASLKDEAQVMLSCAKKMGYAATMATEYLYDEDKSVNEECGAERYRYIRAELMHAALQANRVLGELNNFSFEAESGNWRDIWDEEEN